MLLGSDTLAADGLGEWIYSCGKRVHDSHFTVATLGDLGFGLVEYTLEEWSQRRDAAEDDDEPDFCNGPGEEGGEFV